MVRELLSKHLPRAIINFAAESHVDRSIAGPSAFIQTNVVGTFELLEAARQYWNGLPAEKDRAEFRFLHVSTDEVYGSLGLQDAPATEASPYMPNSPYSASKAGSDHLVRAYHRTYRLPVVTSNCSNNYGPRQYPEKLIPLIISTALAGRPLPVYGTGRNIRDWLYVSDHCEAIRMLLKGGRCGETYNIGGNVEKLNIDVVHSICDLLEEMVPSAREGTYHDQISFVTDRPGHDLRYALDAGKIARELGWRPREDFTTGLRKTVRWYLDNREWTESFSGTA